MRKNFVDYVIVIRKFNQRGVKHNSFFLPTLKLHTSIYGSPTGGCCPLLRPRRSGERHPSVGGLFVVGGM